VRPEERVFLSLFYQKFGEENVFFFLFLFSPST